MKLNEIMNGGFISYAGQEMDDIALFVFKDKGKAARYFNRQNKFYEGTDSGVDQSSTLNGYHVVGEMDWQEFDLFANATFVAFAPTEQSCRALSAKLIEEQDMGDMIAQLGLHVMEATFL